MIINVAVQTYFVFLQFIIKVVCSTHPVKNYLFKVNNRNTLKRCEICSELTTIKTSIWRERHRSDAFVNFEHISHLLPVLLLLSLGWLVNLHNAEQNETAGHNDTVVLLWVPESTWMRVCEIYIASREREAILLNHQQEKWQKDAMMWMKKDIFQKRSAYF